MKFTFVCAFGKIEGLKIYLNLSLELEKVGGHDSPIPCYGPGTDSSSLIGP